MCARTQLTTPAIDTEGQPAYTSKSNMLPSAILLLLLSVRIFAAEPSAPLPAEQLLRLEKNLTQKLEERKQGVLQLDQYRQFAATFRGELDKALAQSPNTPVNRGRHAMILARLDESGPGQAVAGLDRALAERPHDAALLNAKGSIQLQQGDYAGALASAEAVLKKNQERGEAPDPGAVAIRQFSKGRGTAIRGAPLEAGKTSPPDSAQNVRQSVQFTPRPRPGRVEVPLGSPIESFEPPDDSRAGTRALSWLSEQISSGQGYAVSKLDKQFNFRPGEAEIALNGAAKGGIVGAVGGVVVAAIACAPAIFTGAPVLPCIASGAPMGILTLTPTGAFFGGYLGVKLDRERKKSLQFTAGDSESE